MIAQRSIGYNPMGTSDEGTIQAVMAMLSQSHTVSIPRWDCEACGMIHLGAMPFECDSCGARALSQQSDIHCEMNAHW